jgi:hypothetical protein
MLPSGVTIPATVPQRSEIPEGLMNYPALENPIALCIISVSQNYAADEINAVR